MRRKSLAWSAIGGLAIVAAVAQPAHATTTLPLAGVADVVSTGARVFISGGATGTTVVVTRSDGRVETQLGDLPGPTDLQLSADRRTLYVALHGGGIVAFDTRTLRQRARYDTGGTCPVSLALSGQRLWFSYNCGPRPDIGVIDLSIRPATPRLALSQELFFSAPLLTASGPGSDVLLAGEPDISPARIVVFAAASDGALTKVRQSDHLAIGSDLSDFAVTADGSTVFTATGSPYEARSFAVDDLTQPQRIFPMVPYPNALDLSADDTVFAAGANAYNDPDIFVYRTDGTQVATIELDGVLMPKALAWSPSGTRLYAVTGGDFVPTILHVLPVTT